MIRLTAFIAALSLSAAPQSVLQKSQQPRAGRTPVVPTAESSQSIQIGGGVPKDFMILGESSEAPPGYTFAGLYPLVRTGDNPSWNAGPNMPTAGIRGAAVQVGDDVYLLGGFDGSYLNTVWKLNIPTGTWTLETTMPTARSGLLAAEVGGKIYAIGGEVATNVPTSVNEAYDLATHSWMLPRASMPTPRAHLGGGAVNGRIYAIGGITGASVTGMNLEYDPVLNAWLPAKAPMPTPRSAFAAAVQNGLIYTIGGWSGSAYVGTNEVYDPATNTWQSKAALLSARGFLAVAAANTQIYAIGGQRSGSELWVDTVEEYEPLYDYWYQIQSLPTPRSSLCAVATPGGLVYTFGGLNAAGFSSRVDVYDSGFRMLFAHRKN